MSAICGRILTAGFWRHGSKLPLQVTNQQPANQSIASSTSGAHPFDQPESIYTPLLLPQPIPYVIHPELCACSHVQRAGASPDQGLKFRRNFTEIRRKISFSLVTGKKISIFFGKFHLKIQNSKKFGQNLPKFAEIYRNFVSAKHRDFIGKRNG